MQNEDERFPDSEAEHENENSTSMHSNDEVDNEKMQAPAANNFRGGVTARVADTDPNIVAPGLDTGIIKNPG